MDAVGNRLKITEARQMADGSVLRNRTLNYTYDNVYRMTSESDNITCDIVVISYIYDDAGNRIEK